MDIPGRRGKIHTFEGFFFFYQTRHRSDLAGSDYRVPETDEGLWVTASDNFCNSAVRSSTSSSK